MSKVLEDSVLLEIEKQEDEKTSGGLYKVSYNEIPTQLTGVVFDVGPGKLLQNGERVKPTVVVGDKVIIHPNSGYELKVNDKKLRLVRESEILVIF